MAIDKNKKMRRKSLQIKWLIDQNYHKKWSKSKSHWKSLVNIHLSVWQINWPLKRNLYTQFSPSKHSEDIFRMHYSNEENDPWTKHLALKWSCHLIFFKMDNWSCIQRFGKALITIVFELNILTKNQIQGFWLINFGYLVRNMSNHDLDNAKTRHNHNLILRNILTLNNNKFIFEN